MLLTIPVPNMISGVSQQAPSLRYSSQANEQINCQSSIIEGLTKRPPTKHIGILAVSIDDDVDQTAVHLINRDESERYVVMIRGDIPAIDVAGFPPYEPLSVHGIDGTEYSVVYDADTKAYLDCADPSKSIKLLTIADYTFVVNTTKTAAMDTTKTTVRNTEALVTVVAGNYNSDYSVTLNGTTYTYTTSGTDSNTLKTTAIADGLRSYLQGGGGYTAPAGITVSRIGSTLWIRRSDTTDFDISYTDSQSQKAMTLVKGEAATFTDLPTNAPDGFKVKITGDPESVEDEYWVAFRTTDGSQFGVGVWEESFGPDQTYKFNLTTMPHILVREPDGSGGIQFRLKKGEWSDKTVGDATTNPPPSFVGNTITDLFFFKNRLGFISGIDKVTMTETGRYGNFWRTTVVTIVDSEPIDIAVSHTRVSKLQAAVPHNGRLLLFSPTAQFSLGSTGEVLSPSTVSVTQTTEFEADLRARPVATGRSVMFAQQRADFAGIREYIQLATNDVSYDALDVTANVNSYLKNRVLDIDVSTIASMAVVRTEFPKAEDSDPATLYIYKYFINGNEKVQSAWSKWTFPGAVKVLGAGWIDSDLYLVMQRASGLMLEVINVQDVMAESDDQVYLDRLAQGNDLTVTYDASSGRTDIVVPYVCDLTRLRVIVDGRQVVWVTKASSAVSSTVDVRGDLTGSTIHVGEWYPMRYEFGTPFLRAENRIISSGRVGLTYGRMTYDSSAYFVVKVTPKNRNTYAYEFDSGKIQSGIVLDAPLSLESGDFRFPVHAKNNEVVIAVENDTHAPCRLMSAEFEANFVTRSRA